MAAYFPLSPIRRMETSHNEESQAVAYFGGLIHGVIQPHGNAVTMLWSSDSSPAGVSSKDNKGKVQTG